MNMQAVIYVRVSSKEQVTNLSLETQEQRCREHCERQRLRVNRVFVEEGESAKTADRTELRKLLDYCTRHRNQVASVVVYSVSRLARNTQDHLVLRAHFAKLGIKLQSVTEQLDDDTPQGRFMETTFAAFAQLDNELRASRTIDGMKAATQRGYWPFLAPLGYVNKRDAANRPVLEAHSEAGPLVCRAFELGATGQHTLKQLHTRLQAMGLRTAAGNLVSLQTFAKLLRKPIYSGIIDIDKWGVRRPAAFPGLVSEETFERVQAVLAGREHKAEYHSRDREDFPFKHVVRCYHCRKPLTASWSRGRNGTRYGYYHCPTRHQGRVNVRREKLEAEFLRVIEGLQPKPEYLALYKAAVIDSLREERGQSANEERRLSKLLTAFEEKRNKLEQAFVFDGSIERRVYERQSLKLSEQMTLLEMERNDQRADTLDVDAILAFAAKVSRSAAKLWGMANLEQRRSLLQVLFPEGVTFDAGAVRTRNSQGSRAERGIVRTTLTGFYFNALDAKGEPVVRGGDPGGIRTRDLHLERVTC